MNTETVKLGKLVMLAEVKVVDIFSYQEQLFIKLPDGLENYAFNGSTLGPVNVLCVGGQKHGLVDLLPIDEKVHLIEN